MANTLEKFYNRFEGLDTRSNKLLQDPGCFRKGSKNNRYDFQDQITNAQGFQHKDNGAPTFVDIFEYKYRDPNTGAATTEILGVATDGYLYRKKQHRLHFVSHGAATSVSCYYDEIADTFKMTLNGLGSVTISDTLQLSDSILSPTVATLVGKLNALGASVQILDDDGVSVTSTKLAYLLDCVINDTSFADNPVYYWEVVPFPNSSSWPFPVTKANYSSSDYEGISSINLNNCIYMTDGGFPMKYDRKAVYRAGVPNMRQMLYNGTVYSFAAWDASILSDASLFPFSGLSNGTYGYQFRYAFRDYSGAEYYSQINTYPAAWTVVAGNSALDISNNGYPFGLDFPVYGCKVNSAVASSILGGTGADGVVTFTVDTILTSNKNYTNITINAGVNVHLNGYTMYHTGTVSGTGVIYNSIAARTGTETTINVTSGFNAVVGQCLVLKTTDAVTLPIYICTNSFLGYYYAEITAVDVIANTIKIKNVNSIWLANLYGSEVLNAYWVPTEFMNAKENGPWSTTPFGASMQVFRTKLNQIDTFVTPYVAGPVYVVGFAALPWDGVSTAHLYENLADNNLTVLYDDLEPGDELPRGCKYLSQAQNQLMQAGLPLNYTDKDNEYPSSRQSLSSTTSPYNLYPKSLKYTEAMFCDFQSVYWADSLAPEGFSQDGVHEISIDTKFADRVTAIAPNKDSLFGFKTRSTAVISGTFATNDVVLEILEADAGCVSHRSVEEIRGALIWLDGINGFYSCIAGRLPVNVGFPIQDYTKINEGKLDYSQANAANFRKESLYVCSVGTTTFVFDYADNGSLKRDCWYLWDRLNGKSVLATSDDKLLVWDNTRTWKMKLTQTVYDFTDHKSAIPLVINTAWNQQGFPTVDKHYVGFWINSIQGGFTLTVKQYANFLEELIGTQSGVEFIAENSDKKFVKAQVKACIPKLSSISFGMENAEKNKWVRIQGYEIQYSPDFNTGEPKR